MGHRGSHNAAGTKANVAIHTLSLRAFTGNAFTTLRAGLAFTITTLPKTSRLPAFVAGFVRVLILHNPGKVKTPVLDTSLLAISAKLPIIFAQTDFFNSHSVAKASAIAPLVMAFCVAFIGAIVCERKGGKRKWHCKWRW